MDKKINFNNLELFTDKEIADFIYQKMDEEIHKDLDDIDCDFLKECSLLLRQIQGKDEINLSEEQLQELWDKIISRHQNRCKTNQTKIYPPQKEKKRINFKKLFLVAAIIALLSVVSTVIVGANDPFTSFSSNLFGISFKDLFKHDTYKDGNIQNNIFTHHLMTFLFFYLP